MWYKKFEDRNVYLKLVPEFFAEGFYAGKGSEELHMELEKYLLQKYPDDQQYTRIAAHMFYEFYSSILKVD